MIDFPNLDQLTEFDVADSGVNFFYEDIKFELTKKQSEDLAFWVEATIKHEKKEFVNTCFIFCNDAYLHEINMKYLNHDDYTDVITFPYNSNPVAGDIYISIERVKENARNLGVTFEQELYRIMIHGTLHLCGYTDTTPEQRANMTAKENYYLPRLR
jgi:probable rRNA maturation factor